MTDDHMSQETSDDNMKYQSSEVSFIAPALCAAELHQQAGGLWERIFCSCVALWSIILYQGKQTAEGRDAIWGLSDLCNVLCCRAQHAHED